MLNSLKLYRADKAIMERFVWEQVFPEGASIILANGGDGPLCADVIPLGDGARVTKSK